MVGQVFTSWPQSWSAACSPWRSCEMRCENSSHAAAAGGVVGDLGEDAMSGRPPWHEPLFAGQRRRPVNVVLRVPLALLPALVERAQLFDLAAVLPRPVELERHVDVDLPAETRDLGLVDEVDDLEIADVAALFGKDPVHQELLTVRGATLT
jgi:hypothetical protein